MAIALCLAVHGEHGEQRTGQNARESGNLEPRNLIGPDPAVHKRAMARMYRTVDCQRRPKICRRSAPPNAAETHLAENDLDNHDADADRRQSEPAAQRSQSLDLGL